VLLKWVKWDERKGKRKKGGVGSSCRIYFQLAIRKEISDSTGKTDHPDFDPYFVPPRFSLSPTGKITIQTEQG
jgi:hypothetical protein